MISDRRALARKRKNLRPPSWPGESLSSEHSTACRSFSTSAREGSSSARLPAVARAYTVEAWARRPPRKGRASPSRVRRVLDKPFDSASKRGGLVEASPCLRCCQLQLARKTHPHCQTRRSSASTTFSSDSRYAAYQSQDLGPISRPS